MKQGWTYKKLGEVCEIYQPKTLATEQLIVDGKYNVYGANGVIGKYDEYNHEQSEILLTCRGATCGTINVSEPFSWINGNAMVIHRKSEELSFDFLKYLMLSLDYSLIITGAAQPQITRQKLSPTPIKYPTLSVQQSIVAELDKINELIRLKKEQLSDYDKLAQSLFYEMFGDPVENEKSWEVKKFGEIASFKNGLNFGKNENGYSYKILGVGDFKDNFVVNSSSLEYINLNDELSSDYFLKPEDIVFVRSNGSKELVGRCVSVDCTEPTTHSGFCIRCRLNENSGVLPMYLLYVCKNKGIREYLTQSGRGCNISNVNQKILNSTDIIIPPLSNQELFIQRIKLIEQQKAEIQSTIADLETLLASRMQYWFD